MMSKPRRVLFFSFLILVAFTSKSQVLEVNNLKNKNILDENIIYFNESVSLSELDKYEKQLDSIKKTNSKVNVEILNKRLYLISGESRNDLLKGNLPGIITFPNFEWALPSGFFNVCTFCPKPRIPDYRISNHVLENNLKITALGIEKKGERFASKLYDDTCEDCQCCPPVTMMKYLRVNNSRREMFNFATYLSSLLSFIEDTESSILVDPFNLALNKSELDIKTELRTKIDKKGKLRINGIDMLFPEK